MRQTKMQYRGLLKVDHHIGIKPSVKGENIMLIGDKMMKYLVNISTIVLIGLIHLPIANRERHDCRPKLNGNMLHVGQMV